MPEQRPEPRAVTPPRAARPDPEPAPPPRAAEPPEKKSSALIWVLLILVLGGVGGGIAYMQLGAKSTTVSVAIASPRDVAKLFEGTGKIDKGDPVVLSFGESGKVVDVVAAGTEAKQGMPLATLEAYGQIDKQLLDVRDRLAFYERQLNQAKAKGAEEEVKKAEAKVAEKRKLLNELEAKAAKVRLLAPRPGTVAEVMVSAGGEAKAGAPAVRLGDDALAATFKVPAAEAPEAGAETAVQTAAGATLKAKVTRSENGEVTVAISDGGTLKMGDEVRLVQKKEANVIPLPQGALTQRDGQDVVFVLVNGEARLRKVTVAGRSPSNEILVSAGLAPGDSVITTGAESLSDGQQVSTQ
jgi:multidrug efflux pump subunit AcrA (membrane-fusion protein)